MRAHQQVGGGGYTPQEAYQRVMDNINKAFPKKATTYKPPKKPTYHAPSKPKSVKAYSNPAPVTVTPQPSYEEIMKKQQQEYEDKINGIYDKRLSSQLAQLKASQEKAVNGINDQISGVQSDFYDKRNQADVTAMQNAQRLREVMAANGLASSGENVTANVGLQSARQNALGQLNTAEGQQVGQLQNQIADINNPERLNALKQQIESERSQALAGAMQQANDDAWRNYAYNNMSAAQKAQLAQDASQFGENMAWQKYALEYNGNMQMAQNMAALQAYTGFNGNAGGGGYQSDLAQAAKLSGIPASQIPYFNWIIEHESSFNPNAQNPNSTAHGYGQFLNSTERAYEKKTGLNYDNPVDQLRMAYQYMIDRYGSPQGAVNFWQKNHWY